MTELEEKVVQLIEQQAPATLEQWVESLSEGDQEAIGQALAETLESTGLPVIVAAFVVSAALRVAQGSATVALTTAAGLMAPTIEASSAVVAAARTARRRSRISGVP